jgi:PTH1 family peptidyl-tRNA hydrolase
LRAWAIPGRKYRGTRHNIGSKWSDELARRGRRDVRVGAGRGADREGSAGTASTARRTGAAGQAAHVHERSGQAIGELLRYFKIDAADCSSSSTKCSCRWRVCGRGREGRPAATTAEVDHRARRTEFSRLRIGVGRGDERRDLADHVLAGSIRMRPPRSTVMTGGRPTRRRCSSRRGSRR